MLDIFKKNQEDHPKEEKEAIAEQQVQPEPPQEPTIPVELEEQPKINENDLMAMLQTLKEEETTLLTQKTELLTIEEKLRLKTMEEIESTKRRIESLKTEIPELKQKCEGLAKTLEIPVYNSAAD